MLIAGATGGVGQQALQLAAKAGAKVIATAHTDQEAEKVRELGAFQSVDCTGDLAGQVRSLHPDGVDAVLHFAGDPVALSMAVKPGGALVSTIVRDPAQVSAEGVRVVPVYAQPTTAILERLAREHAEGHTRLTVQRVYDLDHAPEAIDDFGSGTLGKLDSTTEWTATTPMSFFAFPLMTNIDMIAPRPVLLVAGANAHSRYYSEDVHAMAPDDIELVIVPDADHVDLYDRKDLIPFDHLDAFFSSNLK